MSICSDSCLSYSSPAHGGWGLVRIGMLVPQSHQLFVCPFACGRHGAIGASIHGNKERLSYLYLEEADLISGSYEDMIIQGVDQLLETLTPQPRALLIMVSCIDDLLATDHQALTRLLEKRHPDIRFGTGHMNPIATDGKLPPHLNIQRFIYSFLEAPTPSQDGLHKDKTVNIIGCNVPPSRDGELYTVLERLGYNALHISQFEDFDDFQKMGSSVLNLLTTSAGKLAADEMQSNLGIAPVFLPVNWDLETICDDYAALAAALGREALPVDVLELLGGLQQQAQDSLSSTRTLLGNRPIAIDDTATTRPYSLAALLCKNGFNVTAIATDGCASIEQTSRDWLLANTDVQTLDYNGHNAPLSRKSYSDVLAIGMECAYLLQTQLIVDITNDDQHYGYHGLMCLLEHMRSAVTSSKDLEQSLMAQGLVI
jgi:nitrogenase molybdenum-iron protein alpha/beta subunit